MSLHLGIPCGQRQCTQRGLDSAGGDGHRGNLQNEDLAIEFGNLKLVSAGTSKCQWTSWVKKVASRNSTTSWTSFNAQNARNATGERSQARGARDRLKHMINFHCCTIRYVAFIFSYDFPLYCSFPDGPQRTISQYNWCWRGLFNHQAFFWWCTSTVIHHSFSMILYFSSFQVLFLEEWIRRSQTRRDPILFQSHGRKLGYPDFCCWLNWFQFLALLDQYTRPQFFNPYMLVNSPTIV